MVEEEEEEIDPVPFGPDGPPRGGGGWGQGFPLTGFVPREPWIGEGGADAIRQTTTVKGTVPWRGPTGPNPDPDVEKAVAPGISGWHW